MTEASDNPVFSMGQLAKGKEPQTLGKEAQKHSEEGQSFLGPFWGQRGTIPVPPLISQAGRRRFLSRPSHSHAQGSAGTHTPQD